MSPHRLQPAFLALRQAYAVPPEPTVGVLAALSALLAGFWNLHVLVLFGMTVGAGIWDLLAGARRARKTKRSDGTDEYDNRILNDGVWDKLFYLFLSLFFGGCGDLLLSLLGGAGDLGFTEVFRTFTPVTASALFFRFGKEVASIYRNVEQTPGGKGAIWNLKAFIDTIRFRLSGNPGQPRPDRRWDDDLTAEDRAWIAEQLGERRRSTRRPEQVSPP